MTAKPPESDIRVNIRSHGFTSTSGGGRLSEGKGERKAV